MSDALVTTAVQHVRESHAPVVDAVGAAAADAAAAWPAAGAEAGARVRSSFRAALDERGVRERLPALLASAVAATGASLPAAPVAAPPYVVVTSTGVVLRATLDPGRLVLELGAFERVDGRYRPRADVVVSGRLR